MQAGLISPTRSSFLHRDLDLLLPCSCETSLVAVPMASISGPRIRIWSAFAITLPVKLVFEIRLRPLLALLLLRPAALVLPC